METRQQNKGKSANPKRLEDNKSKENTEALIRA